ncbi:MAG: hypothetical protein HYS22_08475 [Deltaproteobacteria bacterium]|nr:hypothetical protein [Deltaproteobacteria bacterium]
MAPAADATATPAVTPDSTVSTGVAADAGPDYAGGPIDPNAKPGYVPPPPPPPVEVKVAPVATVPPPSSLRTLPAEAPVDNRSTQLAATDSRTAAQLATIKNLDSTAKSNTAQILALHEMSRDQAKAAQAKADVRLYNADDLGLAKNSLSAKQGIRFAADKTMTPEQAKVLAKNYETNLAQMSAKGQAIQKGEIVYFRSQPNGENANDHAAMLTGPDGKKVLVFFPNGQKLLGTKNGLDLMNHEVGHEGWKHLTEDQQKAFAQKFGWKLNQKTGEFTGDKSSFGFEEGRGVDEGFAEAQESLSKKDGRLTPEETQFLTGLNAAMSDTRIQEPEQWEAGFEGLSREDEAALKVMESPDKGRSGAALVIKRAETLETEARKGLDYYSRLTGHPDGAPVEDIKASLKEGEKRLGGGFWRDDDGGEIAVDEARLSKMERTDSNYPKLAGEIKDKKVLLAEYQEGLKYIDQYEDAVEAASDAISDPTDKDSIEELSRHEKAIKPLSEGRGSETEKIVEGGGGGGGGMGVSSGGGGGYGGMYGEPVRGYGDGYRGFAQNASYDVNLANDALTGVNSAIESVGGLMYTASGGSMDIFSSSYGGSYSLGIMSGMGETRAQQRKIDKMIQQLLQAIASGNSDAIGWLLILVAAQSKKTMLVAAYTIGKHLVAYEKQQRAINHKIAGLNPKGEHYQSNLTNLNSDMQMIASNRQMIVNSLREITSTNEELENIAKSYLDVRGPHIRGLSRWTA